MILNTGGRTDTVQGYSDELKKRRRKMVQKKDMGINSVPVGSEDIIEMYPLDFEEFLWAIGINPHVIKALRIKTSLTSASASILFPSSWPRRTRNSNAKDNVFKVYTADIGLFIEMLGPGTRADIL